MKTFYKVITSVCLGLCLIFAGISLGGLNQINFGNIFHGGFIWNADSISDIYYQSSQKVVNLKMNIFNANVKFSESHNEFVRVDASQIYEGFEVYQSGDTLIIDQSHYWKWFEHYEKSEITIYVPQDLVLDNTELNVSAGNVKFDDIAGKDIEIRVGAGNLNLDGVVCDDLSLSVGMGNANVDDVLFYENLKVSVGMGNADLDIQGQQKEYNYKISAGLGTARIGNEKVNGIGKSESHYGTTTKYIKASCGMGAIRIRTEE